MDKFKVGKKYATSSACDHNCFYVIEVIKRTEKTITYKFSDNIYRKKIRTEGFNEGEEWFEMGRYSMAPVFRPRDEVID